MKQIKSLYSGTPKNPPAYCKHHRCYITVAEMKRHECLQKQCSCMIRFEQHPYWKQREVMKQKRKSRKEAIDAMIGGNK